MSGDVGAQDRAAGGAPVLALQKLTKRFGGLVAVNELTLEVHAGEVFGLLGPNGAGKTTVLNLVSGLDVPSSGSTSIGTRDTTGLPAHRLAAMGVARTYQNVKMFHGLSVLEHVVVGLHRHRKARLWQMMLPVPGEWRDRQVARDQAMALLQRVGLGAVDPARGADTLSYGDQRRLEIARALAVSPTVLLLDEPTAGMNLQESSALGDLVLQLRDEGITVVLVEHNVELVLRYCDRVAVMNFGEKIAEGLPRATLDSPAVREAYFGRTGDDRVERLAALKQEASAARVAAANDGTGTGAVDG